jgi:hypothetical protein
MLRTILLVSAFVLLGPGLALAQLVELEGRYWFTNLEGQVRVDSNSLSGTNVDFKDDLGIDDDDAPGVRLTFGLPLNNKIRLAYTFLKFDSNTTLDQTINFNGSTFAAGTQVGSDLEIHYGRLGWIWQPIAIPGILKVGPMLELKGVVIDANVETRNAVPAIEEGKELGLILPTIGAALDFTAIPKVDLFAEISGLPAGSLGHVLDAEAGIRVKPLPFFTISAGYRLFDVKIEHSDDSAEATLHGPFVGASVRF